MKFLLNKNYILSLLLLFVLNELYSILINQHDKWNVKKWRSKRHFFLVHGVDVDPQIQLWEKDPITKQYEIPYDARNVNNFMFLIRFLWVIKYISRGSNIVFRPREGSDKGYVYLTDGAACESDIGYADGPRTIRLTSTCATTGTINRLLLQILGFTEQHVHQSIRSQQKISVFSIIYSKGVHISHLKTNEYTDELGRPFDYLKQTFLSPCDWSSLFILYPGEKSPPICNIGAVPKTLVPAAAFIRLNKGNATLAEWRCHYDNAEWYNIKGCLIPRGDRFPLMSWINDMKLPTPLMSSYTLKQYCSKLESCSPQILAKSNCFTACSQSCEISFPLLTLEECLKTHFSVCYSPE